jgi:hypothetical protein
MWLLAFGGFAVAFATSHASIPSSQVLESGNPTKMPHVKVQQLPKTSVDH